MEVEHFGILFYCINSLVACSVVYVDEGSTLVLKCPFKSDVGSDISWYGPPLLTVYTRGTRINPIFERLNVTGNTDNGEYHLQISDIKNMDEGKYSCNGLSNSIQKVKVIDVIVTAKPASDPFLQQIPDGLVIDGTTITLTCTVIGGKPIANISWKCDGYFNKEDNSTSTKALSSITLTVSKSDNDKMCNCIATHSLWYSDKTTDILLDVAFAPDTNLTIQRTPVGGIINGEKVNLTCLASGGNPLATLSWNCSGTNTKYTTENMVSYSVEITVDKSDNNKVCTCSAIHLVTTYRSQAHNRLIVYFAPDTNLTLQRKPAGGIISGNKVNLTCIASGGNPLATLSWNCSGTNTKYTAENTVSHSVEFEVDKSDNNKLCICSGTHPVTSYRPTVENRLLVYFKPFLDTSRYNTPANIDISENDYLFITVSVKSNPHPIITWTFIAQEHIDCYNNSVINSTSLNVGLNSSSNISIYNLKKNQFGKYTFMATNVVGNFLRNYSVLRIEEPISLSYVYVVCKITTAIVIFKPISNGNLPVELYIQYTVEGKYMTSIQVNMNNRNQPIQYTVTGLSPGRKYNFSILAVNLYGETRSNQVKCSTDTLSKGEDMLTLNDDNSGMLTGGIAALVVGLLFVVAATIFIFRKRFKKTYTKSSKSDEYFDLQTSNHAFQDPYASIQNSIESRHHQEPIANTYEECGNASDAAAYQNIENMKSGHKMEEKNMGIYDNMKI